MEISKQYSVSYNQQHIDIAGLSYNQSVQVVYFQAAAVFEVVNNPANYRSPHLDWQNNPFATPDGFFDAYATNPYWTTANSEGLLTSDS
jgi:hypothetical protein